MRLIRPVLAIGLLLGIAPAAGARPAAPDEPWHPEVDHRPRLALDGRDVDHLARLGRRIEEGVEPWAPAYGAVRDRAEGWEAVPHGSWDWRSEDDAWGRLYARETRNGLLARSLALVAFLGSEGVDPGWRPLPRREGEETPRGWLRRAAARAAAIIEGMYATWPCARGWPVIRRGITMAGSLLHHVQAFDLLAGLPPDLRPDLGPARARLEGLAADVHRFAWTVDLMQNNHSTRVHAALGAATVGLNGPRAWMDRVERVLGTEGADSDLRHQAATGAWAEGTSYHRYSAAIHLPFFLAHGRCLGEASPWMRSGLVRGPVRWGLRIARPDGLLPAIDDARPHRSFAPGLFCNRFPGVGGTELERRRFARAFLEAGAPGMRGARAYELLAAFDPSPALLEEVRSTPAPDPPGLDLLPRQGQAVLRSGPGSGAGWVLVLAERGEARRHGEGHEHVDPASFTYRTRGEPVVLDPGYGGWPRHEETNGAVDHSVLLVDGEGPPGPWLGPLGWMAGGADVRIEEGERTVSGGPVRSVRVRTRYRGTDIARTFTLVGRDLLVVEDQVEVRPDLLGRVRPRRLESLLQLGGGGEKAHPLEDRPHGVGFATHERGLPVEVRTLAPGRQATRRTTTNEDHLGSDAGPSGHGVLHTSVRGRRARILTVIAVGAGPDAPPAVEVAETDPAAVVRAGTRRGEALVLSNPTGQTVAIPLETTGSVSTDATFALLGRTEEGDPWWVAHEATTLRHDLREVASRETRGTLRNLREDDR